jgi:hypothetical protein
MFTIMTIRTATCDDCNTIGNGVEIVLTQDSGAKAFLCWKHFRMTLEAIRAASMLPVDGNGALQVMVQQNATAPPRTMDERSHDGNRQNFLHGETKGGTDTRDTGGEG